MGSCLNKIARGSFSGDGSDKKVVTGFKPRYVEIYNVTDQIDYKKSETMAGDSARKEAASGAKTYPSAAEIEADGFKLLAAENVAGKEFHYVAYESKSE